jgi:hypothetical protein
MNKKWSQKREEGIMHTLCIANKQTQHACGVDRDRVDMNLPTIPTILELLFNAIYTTP